LGSSSVLFALSVLTTVGITVSKAADSTFFLANGLAMLAFLGLLSTSLSLKLIGALRRRGRQQEVQESGVEERAEMSPDD
jgi:hypothetical protein